MDLEEQHEMPDLEEDIMEMSPVEPPPGFRDDTSEEDLPMESSPVEPQRELRGHHSQEALPMESSPVQPQSRPVESLVEPLRDDPACDDEQHQEETPVEPHRSSGQTLLKKKSRMRRGQLSRSVSSWPTLLKTTSRMRRRGVSSHSVCSGPTLLKKKSSRM